MNPIFLIRLILAAVFLLSGFEKLISPYQNFLYVLQSYQLPFPSVLENVLAHIVPWIEFLVGIFLLTGLWLNISACAALIFFTSFITIVGQAIARHLPIDKCGCFGDAVSVPLPVMFSIDTFLWLLTLVLVTNIPKAKFLSLDAWFEK